MNKKKMKRIFLDAPIIYFSKNKNYISYDDDKLGTKYELKYCNEKNIYYIVSNTFNINIGKIRNADLEITNKYSMSQENVKNVLNNDTKYFDAISYYSYFQFPLNTYNCINDKILNYKIKYIGVRFIDVVLTNLKIEKNYTKYKNDYVYYFILAIIKNEDVLKNNQFEKDINLSIIKIFESDENKIQKIIKNKDDTLLYIKYFKKYQNFDTEFINKNYFIYLYFDVL